MRKNEKVWLINFYIKDKIFQIITADKPEKIDVEELLKLHLQEEFDIDNVRVYFKNVKKLKEYAFEYHFDTIAGDVIIETVNMEVATIRSDSYGFI